MHSYNVVYADKDLKRAMVKVIGNKIKKIRLEKSLTQEQLSEIAGIHPKYLGEIERGEKNPTASVVHKLSVALDVPICKLIPSNCCSANCSMFFNATKNLIVSKKPDEVRKAVRILEVFFE